MPKISQNQYIINTFNKDPTRDLLDPKVAFDCWFPYFGDP